MSKVIVKEEEAREKQELSGESRIPGLDGEWSNDDVSIPRLQVVAKTSDLVDEGFEPGSLVLSKEVTVAKKEEVVDIIVVN
ncbi:MAG: hypothetical protein Q8P12_00010, partial [bacterium]|nr:hypothetical protein [bacterium]